ncbi:substrate-binding and VWA domain-containing protein [Umezawaea endophytica]|uniref:Substrate-binding and VWA domain-containing protein n=1 Tax=Umezawaea endophytica TaxID=1654476 RepID=A0A9X2VWM0_9PSEU|nr:substrate-binding and VWA domain-containing protein [Umezawaea endophytica]MCS7484266.1 substrate-binding and VWA domain-containing protein [Umezawaea endophytica]
MSSRNQPTTSLLRRIALPVGALIGVVAAVSVTVVALKATSGPDCQGALPLKVAVTPAAEDVVRQTASEYQSTQPIVDGKCVQVQIESRGAADVAKELPTAQINPPALWIPDSSMWAAETQKEAGEIGQDAPRLDVKDSLASSPMVIAGSEQSMSKLGWPVTPISWSRVVDPAVPVTLSDPTQSTEGLATLAVVRGLLGNPDGSPKPELVSALLRVGREALPSVRDAFNKVTQGAENAPIFTASEQNVMANNRSVGERRVVASYPKEGTLGFDFPLVRVSRAGEHSGTEAAAAGFEKALRSPEAAKRFADAGFRTPQGRAPDGWTTEKDGVNGDQVNLLKAPTTDQVSELLRTWGAIALDSRMLAVLDVSGSMAEKMSNGQTRIEAATQAALTALSLMPDTSDIGLWAFSTDKKPPNDWISLVPIGPLGEPLGGKPRREVLVSGAQGLASIVGGGTALNDTALAAWRFMQSTYDPAKINSVTLITDGRNDDISSVDMAELVKTFQTEGDPARPVPMIMVGLGQEADMDALRQISAATGGKAYQALQPADIQGVLLDAISQRRCRPNC